MISNRVFCVLFLLFAAGLATVHGQDGTYHRYSIICSDAYSAYFTKNYEKAAEQYATAFALPNAPIFSIDLINAADANAKIQNDKKVKQYLFEVLPKLDNVTIKELTKKLSAFEEYKDKDWWSTFESGFNDRLLELEQHHENLKIFKKGSTITYKAMRVSSYGDTLANTHIHLGFDGKPYLYEGMFRMSSLAMIAYDFTSQDKADHKKELRKSKIRNEWISTKEFAVVETEELVAMSPFWNNEFFKTWIAPIPVVYLPISNGSMAKAGRNINDFDRSHGRIETGYLAYEYNGRAKMKNDLLGDLTVHHFRATKKTNIYGTNNLDYFFHPEHGFVALVYETFDGETISFIRAKSD